MDEEFGLDGVPQGPFHPADLLVSLALFARDIFGAFRGLFTNLAFDGQRFANFNRDRRVMRAQTLADIRSLA